MSATAPEIQSLCCEIADAITVVAPRRWTEATVKLDRKGEQLRVSGIDARLDAPPLPKPDLGMDEAGRMGGMSAAFTELLHAFHPHGVSWDGTRAVVSRPTSDRLVMTLVNQDGRPATSMSVGREYLDALFLSDAFLDALALAEPIIAERQTRLMERLADCVRWSYSQPERRATFELPGGRRLEIAAQFLGTWSLDDESWLWGWANTAVEPGCTEQVERALRIDEREAGLAVFWRERYPCEEAFAAKVALLAGTRAGATAVHRGRVGGAWAYLALME
jgi:hypothetical protein